MGHYFFHTADGVREADKEGMELPTQEDAQREGIKYLADILHSEPDLLMHGEDFRVEVTDERGMMLYSIITLAVSSPATGHV